MSWRVGRITMATRDRPMLPVRLTARFHWAVVGGAILESLTFAAFGAYNVWLNGRVDPSALVLQYLFEAAIFALAAGFGLGAFLLNFRRLAMRIVGAAFHLGATALATLGTVWMGQSGVQVSPNTYGYWSPWIAFAVAAAVIATGLAVLISFSSRSAARASPRLSRIERL